MATAAASATSAQSRAARSRAGAVNLNGGPWSVTDNTVLGAAADTYSTAAFSLTSAHDVVLQGNNVTSYAILRNPLPVWSASLPGTVKRHNQGQLVRRKRGQFGDEATYDVIKSAVQGLNDQAMTSRKSRHGVLFKRRPAAISSDGRLLMLPDLQLTVNTLQPGLAAGPGAIGSILAGVNSNGSAKMTTAGEGFLYGEQTRCLPGNDGFEDLELLMQDPLPAMPSGGYYIIEVNSGYVNTSFISNSINLNGKSSTGFVLTGDDFGARVIGNAFYAGHELRRRIHRQRHLDPGPSSNHRRVRNRGYPKGYTGTPDLGTLIENNVIQDALGGVHRR